MSCASMLLSCPRLTAPHSDFCILLPSSQAGRRGACFSSDDKCRRSSLCTSAPTARIISLPTIHHPPSTPPSSPPALPRPTQSPCPIAIHACRASSCVRVGGCATSPRLQFRLYCSALFGISNAATFPFHPESTTLAHRLSTTTTNTTTEHVHDGYLGRCMQPRHSTCPIPPSPGRSHFPFPSISFPNFLILHEAPPGSLPPSFDPRVPPVSPARSSLFCNPPPFNSPKPSHKEGERAEKVRKRGTSCSREQASKRHTR
ncbi:hypothetical protein BS50DRAFT_16517 [Corynespora cassiicola Philippines]|uniref:Uncharacterized protein n=1 Tax=Corynespora cassiicola Philippines TaxID=1448308 RepID=A0A2T2P9W9_CORCC|nr:hypothetical protein BS50DRAFT_16517 [Corynespora cassiicola Philippines]